MKLQKTLSRLQRLHPKEIDLSLDRIKKLCKKLGNPQDNIKAISIAVSYTHLTLPTICSV